MRPWLLLDPTGPEAGVALAHGDVVLAEARFPSPRFIGFLGTGLDGLWEAAGAQPPAAGIGVVVGPGSIMGGRAAVAWARGAALGGPCLRGVSSLEVLRRHALGAASPDRQVWAVGQAVREEIYLAVDGAAPKRTETSAAVALARAAGPLWAGWVPEELARDPGAAELAPATLPAFAEMWAAVQCARDLPPEALKPLILYPPPIK